ncbi:MAG: M28 family metallopeptidase [Bryobacteraceae bacterium]
MTLSGLFAAGFSCRAGFSLRGTSVPLLALTLTALAQAADSNPTRWWNHVKFLADDRLEGREAGSRGHRAAADYVAQAFQQAGAKPCAPTGYALDVPLVRKSVVESNSSLTLGNRAMKLGDDAILTTRTTSVDAPLVFAGYGLSIPEAGYDDLAEAHVKGAVIVYLTGSPAHIAGPLRAFYSSAAERSKALRARGAIGSISIPNPKTADVPWTRTVAARLLPTMALANAILDEGRELRLGASVNPEQAAFLFEGSKHELADLFALATAGKALPRFPLKLRVRARAQVEQSTLTSQNVCAMMPGSDDKLRAESMVLTAHIDHLGLSPTTADHVYNGAMDNASGVATLIETARSLASGPRLRRSVVLLATTGEEKGLLGSKHFALAPPPAVGKIVAAINMDMFLPIHPMKSAMAFGLDESTLRSSLERVAKRLGLGVVGDPEPHRNRFIRSDQFNFILQGVPALALKVGYVLNTPEAELQKKWTAARYHAVSDDLTQPIDMEAAAKFNATVLELAREVANADSRPRWNDASFFRRFARN